MNSTQPTNGDRFLPPQPHEEVDSFYSDPVNRAHDDHDHRQGPESGCAQCVTLEAMGYEFDDDSGEWL